MDKRQKGTDHKLSLEPTELRQLIVRIRSIENIQPMVQVTDDQSVLDFLSKFLTESELSDVKLAIAPIQRKCIQECEMACRLKLGKSLVYRKSLKCGQIVSIEDICAKVSEPFGISAEFFDNFIGQTLCKDVEMDENVHDAHFMIKETEN